MALEQTEGQAETGLSGLSQVEGTTGEAPGGAGEQVSTSQQTTNTGPASTEESFFDPSTLTDDMMPAYKQMQAAFTKKNQALKDQMRKIEAYDAFQQNPQSVLQQLANQYGYQLITGAQSEQSDEWEPKSWDDVMQRAREEVMREINPELKSMRQKQMERTLDEISPDWRMYEDDMMKTLQKHPTLVQDPETLYRMSVPPQILESRATQAALKKLQQKGESAQLSSGSRTTRSESAGPDNVNSFADAVKFAEAQLASKGMRP